MPAALLLLWLGAVADVGTPPDTVVVCPAEFREALAPWVQLRSGEGHVIQVVSNDGTPDDIRGRIRAANRDPKLRYVLLVGGADPQAARDANIRRRSVPPHLEQAKVNIHWSSEPQIATDNWYADLDGDGVPDVAIGRLTVRSAAELTVAVKKIVAYEGSHDFRRWRSRINFVAGVGGFGPMVDGAVQIGARQLIENGVPAGYRTSLTLADWHSAYCPDPRKFHDTTLSGLNEGCWLWVFLGHAGPTELDSLHLPGSREQVLNCGDVSRLHCTAGSPVALFMACYTGAYDGSRRCLADELLRTEGGPVSIVCASRVTMPYGMAVLGAGMLDELFAQRTTTLGEAILHAKRRSVDADGPSWDSRRLALDTLAHAFGPPGEDLVAERREHLSLFNLFGDPLLRLRYPREAPLEVDRTAGAGDWFTIRGKSPLDGAATIELTAVADRTTFAASRQQFDASDEALAAYQTTYEQANQPPLTSAQMPVGAGRAFSARMKLPQDALGKYRVRVFIAGKDDFALGAADFESRQSAPAEVEANLPASSNPLRHAAATR
jgi:hypothetical protein